MTTSTMPDDNRSDSQGNLLGSIIANRYRVLRKLGAGGMGMVVLAHDQRLDREVALKLLHAESVGDTSARARLLREARAAAALEHPNIVRMYDVGETDEGLAYLVMEFVRGKSLVDRDVVIALSLPQRVKVIQDIAEAVGYAHSHGFVHRDLKPANVMLKENGTAVVLDFGLARKIVRDSQLSSSGDQSAPVTVEGTVLGTPAYMAPEQAIGGEISDKCDQFSLAVLAYELLTGRLPWNAPTLAGLISARLVEVPPRTSVIAPWLSSDLDAIFLKALAREPSDRYESVLAFSQELGKIPLPERPTHNPEIENAVTVVAASVKTPATTTSQAAAQIPLKSEERARGSSKTLQPLWVWGIVALGVALGSLSVWTLRKSANRGTQQGNASGNSLNNSSVTDASHVLNPLVQDSSSVLACPLLTVTGTSDSVGWIAAATAHSLCEQAAIAMGGAVQRTLVPAELLDFPVQPTEELAFDPFDSPTAATQTRTRAHERATVWLDGQIEERLGRFFITVTLRDRQDRSLATAQGDAQELFKAAHTVVKQLVVSGALRGPASANSEYLHWSQYNDLSVALDIESVIHRSYSGRTTEDCQFIDQNRSSIGDMWYTLHRDCRHSHLQLAVEPAPQTTTINYNNSGVLFARQIWNASNNGDEIDVPRARTKLQTDLEQAQTPFQRAIILATLSSLVAEQDFDEARVFALSAVAAMPREGAGWDALLRTALDRRGSSAIVRLFASWNPDSEENGNYLARYSATSRNARLRYQRLGYRISGHSATAGFLLGDALLEAGDPEATRAVASELATQRHSLAQSVSEHLRIRVLIAEGRFSEAYTHAQAFFARQERIGWGINGDILLASVARDLAWILGQSQPFAEEFIVRFVDAQPSRLVLEDGGILIPVLSICALASPESARRCVDKIGRLLATPDGEVIRNDIIGALIQGVVPYAQRNYAQAVNAWQPLASAGGLVAARLALVLSTALDNANRHELAAQIDAPLLEQSSSWAGATPAHVRAAQRAVAMGDRSTARTQANLVVQAWSRVVGQIPVLDSMREIARATP